MPEDDDSEHRKIDVETASVVSALWLRPLDPMACFVFAHGAGAGMSHAFMERPKSSRQTSPLCRISTPKEPV
jgi:hypothetical protein